MNQVVEFASNVDKQLSRWLGAIPALIPIFQSLNIVSIINRYCPSKADVDEGTVALVLALNRLMSPRPLYKVSEWMAETILEETLSISPEKFHDRRLGDLLDAIHKARLDEGKRNTLLKRYLELLESIQKRINVRRYKKAEYVKEQIGKAQGKYPSVRQLVDIQLTGDAS